MTEAFALLFSGDPETWSIIWTSLRFSFVSTAVSVIVGVPAGTALALSSFPLKKALAAVVNALTALPTVVIGLLIYSLFSRSGPLGFMGLMFEPGGVMIGQSALAAPIVTALVYTGFTKLDPRFIETVTTLGASRLGVVASAMIEARYVIASAVVTAFGRVTGEVGVSMMLGGNIRWSTRTMTTAIALDTAKGEFERALSLGFVLLAIALAVNATAHWAVRHER